MTKQDAEKAVKTFVKAIAAVQAAYHCPELEAITKMQGAAAAAEDEWSLEILCEMKNAILGF